ncbi:MAG: hypothetical protein IPK16_17685 [Anaerolineales bacterium]|nr:hypothetical protein [Anaerolineales bacterium]
MVAIIADMADRFNCVAPTGTELKSVVVCRFRLPQPALNWIRCGEVPLYINAKIRREKDIRSIVVVV